MAETVPRTLHPPVPSRPTSDNYKWVALSNTTLAVLLATLDASITLIAMPDIFRGIHLDPLIPSNSFYLLWMILGYLVVSSVLIVSLGRLGDMYGRVRMYNLGFVIYTVASLILAVDWMTGQNGATYLIIFRIVQGIGGACLLANASAIITDAFPVNQRGHGARHQQHRRRQRALRRTRARRHPRADRLAPGLPDLGAGRAVRHRLGLPEARGAQQAAPRADRLVGQRHVRGRAGPDHDRRDLRDPARTAATPTGWTSPRVLVLLGGGVASLAAFVFIERRVENPMFRLPLFRIRAFTYGTLSTFLAAVARGGLMFMLIIWLQGIWLPQHGYSFSSTPLWAGIYMLPLTLGMLITGPASGALSDRYGPRPFATGGMLLAASSFALLLLLPTNFAYPWFALVLLLNGFAIGLFAAPNRAAVMNSLPRGDRGAGGGMNQTFQNSAQVLSIGIFFTLMIVGLSSSLPQTLSAGLEAHGVASATAHQIGNLPPVSILFAAFLGYNPIEHLLGAHTLATLSAHDRATLTGPSFFPKLISGPFRSGLRDAFGFAICACVIASAAAFFRGGGTYHHTDESVSEAPVLESSA